MDSNGKPVTMELDTGAEITTLPLHVYEKLFQSSQLCPTDKRLSQYDGSPLKILGEMPVTVGYKGQVMEDSVLVVDVGSRYPLLGRDWMFKVRFDWNEIFYGQTEKGNARSVHEVSLSAFQNKYQELFSEGLGEVRGMSAQVDLEPGTQPRFFKCRPVPFALRDQVNKELERQIKEGELVPVEKSEWAAPLVIVRKSGGSVRICADYKVTVNPSVKEQAYRLPTAEEIFSTLAHGESFSKLDLANAYKQLPLVPDSQAVLTMNTPLGLLMPTRLPFGLKVSPNLWQRTMDDVLKGLTGVACYLDDLLVTGRSREEHKANLEAVMQRLQEYGLRLRREKCELFREKIVYLGHEISKDGLRPTGERVKGIVDMPEPTNTKELLTFLGLMTYNAKFIPNLSAVLRPLYDLTRKGAKWVWTLECQHSFDQAKASLSSAGALAHYDVDRPLKMYCDASSKGVGACIVHQFPGGAERPVAYASRSLSEAEQKYAQIEREGLAIVFGVKRFHQYICGRRFTLVTDHRPLCRIFSPSAETSSVAAARLQRWALILSMYDYEIEFVSGLQNVPADVLSRLPSPKESVTEGWQVCSATEEGEQVCLSIEDDVLPVTADEVAKETSRDPVLGPVLGWVRSGAWPKKAENPDCQPYIRFRDSLTVVDGCLQLGEKVVIPSKFRRQLLDELHVGHLGVCRMKSLARGFMWWPHLDADVERLCKQCYPCQANAQMPATASVHPWVYPSGPWERVHIDFASHQGKCYLILVDAFSKWPEIEEMHGTTASKTIETLTKIFATHGFPITLVSDNGPPFTSDEFKRYLLSRGIFHRTTPPYHPASNGQAESMVRTFKSFLRKQLLSGVNRGTVVCQFLARYRVTPCSSTGRAPAELMLGRMPRTKLSLLKPSVTDRMRGDEGFVYSREFVAGDSVLLRDLRPGSSLKWRPATVTARVGPLVYEVCVDGRTRRAHLDHLLADRTENRPGPPTLDRPAPAVVPELERSAADSGRGASPTGARSSLTAGEPVSPQREPTGGPVPQRASEGPMLRQWQTLSPPEGLVSGGVGSEDGCSRDVCGEPLLRRSERLRKKFL